MQCVTDKPPEMPIPSAPVSVASNKSDLNPEAVPFELPQTNGASPLRARATTFVPPNIEDTAASSSAAIVDGLTWDKETGVLRLTFDTIDTTHYRPLQLHEAIINLAAVGHLPAAVQLNILTGSRLPRIHYVNNLITNVLGPYITVVKTLQITIMRHGEYIGNRFTIPEMELEKFSPLRQFVGEIVRTFPQTVKFIWGCAALHEAHLKEHFHHKAIPAAQNALQDHKANGVAAYSSAIDGKILENIAHWFIKNSLRGRKCDLEGHANYIARFNTPGLQEVPHIVYPRGLVSNRSSASASASFNPNFNPEAAAFVPLIGPLPNDAYEPQHSNVHSQDRRDGWPTTVSNLSPPASLFVPGQPRESGAAMYSTMPLVNYAHIDRKDPFAQQTKSNDKFAREVPKYYKQSPSYNASEHHAHGFDAGIQTHPMSQQYIPPPGSNYYSPTQHSDYTYIPDAQSFASMNLYPASYGQPNAHVHAPPRLYNPTAAAMLSRGPVAVHNSGFYASNMPGHQFSNDYPTGSGYGASAPPDNNNNNAPVKKAKSKYKYKNKKGRADSRPAHNSINVEMPHFDPKMGFGVAPSHDHRGFLPSGPMGYVEQEFLPLTHAGMKNNGGGTVEKVEW